MALNFKTGDEVRFLNDTGGGVVERINPDGLIFVRTGDGFEIPVTAKDLVHALAFDVEGLPGPETAKAAKDAAPAGNKEKKSMPEPVKEEAPAPLPVNIAPESRAMVLVGVIPDQPGPVFSSELAVYLINDSPYLVYFSVGTRERGSLYHLASGMIEADTKRLLATMNQTGMSRITGLHVQLIWVSGGRYHRLPPVDELIDIQTVNFSKESYYRDNEYFKESAVLFAVAGKEDRLLAEQIEVPSGIAALKNDTGKTRSVSDKPEKPEVMEVDLHMDESDLQSSSLPLSGILALQISRFHAAMEEAISKKYRKIVIIHGVGQGTLKLQIRKELQEKYPGFVFQDASFREYGFGATMVHLTADSRQ